ncbi:MAG TPA: hypothetical protein VEX66_06740 [Microlunatus sp.]|nr:hypothetical protein [Microlunatus sp.]
MRVEIKQGGDGVACWNAEAIAAYAASVDVREAALAAANPDLVVTPGLVKCYGCERLEFDMGFGCTAKLTRTLYAVADEVAPRPADAAGSLADIAGLQGRIDADDAVEQVPATHAAEPVAPVAPVPPAAPSAPARRSGLKGLLGRRG